MIWLGLTIAIIVLVWYFLKGKKTTTAFGKELVYIDSNIASSDGVVAGELLVNQDLGVSGKPDFVVKSEDGKYFIPIEIKSGNIEGNDPYPEDKMQLATYIALTTARLGPVAYGEIHYRNK